MTDTLSIDDQSEHLGSKIMEVWMECHHNREYLPVWDVWLAKRILTVEDVLHNPQAEWADFDLVVRQGASEVLDEMFGRDEWNIMVLDSREVLESYRR